MQTAKPGAQPIRGLVMGDMHKVMAGGCSSLWHPSSCYPPILLQILHVKHQCISIDLLVGTVVLLLAFAWQLWICGEFCSLYQNAVYFLSASCFFFVVRILKTKYHVTASEMPVAAYQARGSLYKLAVYIYCGHLLYIYVCLMCCNIYKRRIWLNIYINIYIYVCVYNHLSHTKHSY